MNPKAAGAAESAGVDLKFEVAVIPVADVDRSKDFYEKLGWRLDADLSFDNGFRVVQFTPPGSGCSVQFGTKITGATPGSASRSLPRRVRHRGGPPGVARTGRSGQRSVPCGRPGCPVPTGWHRPSEPDLQRITPAT